MILATPPSSQAGLQSFIRVAGIPTPPTTTLPSDAKQSSR